MPLPQSQRNVAVPWYRGRTQSWRRAGQTRLPCQGQLHQPLHTLGQSEASVAMDSVGGPLAESNLAKKTALRKSAAPCFRRLAATGSPAVRLVGGSGFTLNTLVSARPPLRDLQAQRRVPSAVIKTAPRPQGGGKVSLPDRTLRRTLGWLTLSTRGRPATGTISRDGRPYPILFTLLPGQYVAYRLHARRATPSWCLRSPGV